MDLSTLVNPGVETVRKLRAFALCFDELAVVHVHWLRAQLTGLAANGLDLSFHLQTPGFPVVHESSIEMRIETALRSDVLVIAMSSLQRREPAVIQWLNSLESRLAAKSCEPPGLLIGLFGGAENRAGELGWLVSEMVSFTRRTGMDFVWQWMGHESECDWDWLAISIDELLARQDHRSTR